MDLVGYDLDGTLTPNRPPRNKPYFKQNGAERRAHEVERLEHYRTSPVTLRPTGDWCIISGRPVRYLDATLAWIKAHDLDPLSVDLMNMTVTRANQITHKIICCKSRFVVRYYEDDPKIAAALARAGIPVVLVGKPD